MRLATTIAPLQARLPDGMGLTLELEPGDVLGQPLVLLRPSRAADPRFAALTPREREVASLVAVGLRNKDVALALGISVTTVKDHVHRILHKSGLDGRSAIAATYRSEG